MGDDLPGRILSSVMERHRNRHLPLRTRIQRSPRTGLKHGRGMDENGQLRIRWEGRARNGCEGRDERWTGRHKRE